MSSDSDSPITSRPWFRPAVGLWFAMLLAAGVLGVLAVAPPATRDGLFRSSGLAALHPFFEPPVGTAGLAFVGILAALVGLLLGLAIAARLVGKAKSKEWDEWNEPVITVAEPEADAEENGRRRVLFAREDIGENGIALTGPAEDEDEHVEEEPVEAADEADDLSDPDPEPRPAPIAEPEPVPPAPAAGRLAEPTLAQLTERLAAALEGHKAAILASHSAGAAEEFDTARPAPAVEGEDAQAALRSALDKLGRIGQVD